MNFVEILVEEHCDLQQRSRREPRHSHAAISLQPEERAQPLLTAARRAQLDQEMGDRGADVLQPMRRARRDLEHVARPEHPATAADAELQLARDPLEPLPLAPVDVRGHEAPGADEELGRDAGGRAPAKDDRLAGHGVRDAVYAVLDHMI
jgi:hypothetical protein